MPLLNTCCGCLSIRTGAFVSCAYSLIYSLVALGLSAYSIHTYKSYAGFNWNQTSLTLEIGTEQKVLYIANCVDISLYGLLIAAIVLVIIGIKRLHRFLLIPYLIIMGMLVLLQLVVCLLAFIALALIFSSVSLFELFLAILCTVADAMCLLCVFSYYQELRDGRAQIRANYTIRIPEPIVSEKTDFTTDGNDSDAPPSYANLPGTV